MKRNFLRGAKLGPKLGFHYFLKFPSLVFLDIAQDWSLGKCLTSNRAEAYKKIFSSN